MNERGKKFIEGALFTFNAVGSSLGFFALAYYAQTQNELPAMILFTLSGFAAFAWPFYRIKYLAKKKPAPAPVQPGIDLKAFMQAVCSAQQPVMEENEMMKMVKPCQACGHGAEHHEDIACRKCDCGEYQ